MPCWFMRTNAHAHQYCIFQSYAKTVPSRMKLTMKLTMREPASMTMDTWSRRVTSDFNSVLWGYAYNLYMTAISKQNLPPCQLLIQTMPFWNSVCQHFSIQWTHLSIGIDLLPFPCVQGVWPICSYPLTKGSPCIFATMLFVCFSCSNMLQQSTCISKSHMYM